MHKWPINTWRDTEHHQGNANFKHLKNHFTVNRMAKIKKKKKTENTKYWWRFGAPGVLTLVRIENHSTFLKNCLAAPAKVKHTRTLWPSNYISRFLPRRNENTCLQKTYNSLIHNSQKLQRDQRFLNKNIDKFWYTPTMQYYSATKRYKPVHQHEWISKTLC